MIVNIIKISILMIIKRLDMRQIEELAAKVGANNVQRSAIELTMGQNFGRQANFGCTKFKINSKNRKFGATSLVNSVQKSSILCTKLAPKFA